jgi:rhamnose transport system permease protein
LAPEQTTAAAPEQGHRQGGQPLDHPVKELLRPLMRWETGLVLADIGILIFGVLTSSQFLTSGNLFNLCVSIGEVAIMTLPLTLIVITGEIDLSVASILGLSSAMVGYLFSHGWTIGPIFVTVLAIGAVAGAFNGILITRLGLPSLAVTIGTLTLYRGFAIVILGPLTISTFPERYTNIGINTFPHTFLSWSIAIFLVLAVVFGVVLHFTPLGRSLYVMGANPQAALYAGIRVKRIKTLLYIVSGVVCSFAGVLYTFKLSTAVQDNGLGLELTVVAIVLLGGVSIFGGKGSIVGVVLAVFLYAGLQNALLLTNFPQRALGIVTGGLLLFSVLVPNMPSFWRRGRAALKRFEARGQTAAGNA